MSIEEPTVAEDLKAATAAVVVRMSWQLQKIAVAIDLPATVVENERITEEYIKAVEKEAHQNAANERSNNGHVGATDGG